MFPDPERSAEIFQLITSEFRHDFEPVYEMVLTATGDRTPGQPNSDIRNTWSHLADAMTAGDFDEANWHVLRAMRHLRFAKYDSLSIILAYRLLRVCDFVNWTRRRGIIQPDLRGRILEIRTAFPKIEFRRIEDNYLAIEHIKRMTEKNADIENLIADCNEFDHELLVKFPALAQQGRTFFQRYKSIANVNLEERFPWIAADDGGTPQKQIEYQSRKLLSPPRSTSPSWRDWWEDLSPRSKAFATLWCYAAGLCIVLSSAELAILKSVELLIPIFGICILGAAIGSYSIALELDDGGSTQLPK
jgi:hypothetical protein